MWDSFVCLGSFLVFPSHLCSCLLWNKWRSWSVHAVMCVCRVDYLTPSLFEIITVHSSQWYSVKGGEEACVQCECMNAMLFAWNPTKSQFQRPGGSRESICLFNYLYIYSALLTVFADGEKKIEEGMLGSSLEGNMCCISLNLFSHIMAALCSLIICYWPAHWKRPKRCW